jgi:hypothetical protein
MVVEAGLLVPALWRAEDFKIWEGAVMEEGLNMPVAACLLILFIWSSRF